MSLANDSKFNLLDPHRLRADVADVDGNIPTGKFEDLGDPALLLDQVRTSLESDTVFNSFSYLDPALALKQIAVAYAE